MLHKNGFFDQKRAIFELVLMGLNGDEVFKQHGVEDKILLGIMLNFTRNGATQA